MTNVILQIKHLSFENRSDFITCGMLYLGFPTYLLPECKALITFQQTTVIFAAVFSTFCKVFFVRKPQIYFWRLRLRLTVPFFDVQEKIESKRKMRSYLTLMFLWWNHYVALWVLNLMGVFLFLLLPVPSFCGYCKYANQILSETAIFGFKDQ